MEQIDYGTMALTSNIYIYKHIYIYFVLQNRPVINWDSSLAQKNYKKETLGTCVCQGNFMLKNQDSENT